MSSASTLSATALPTGGALPRAADLRARMARARHIRDQLHGDASYRPLRGRHLALLTSADHAWTPRPLQQAAGELGARVAQVRQLQDGIAGDDDVQRLGRTLGRLYDAIDCAALPPRTLFLLHQAAGVPVYDGLDGALHPLRALADLMTLLEHPLARREDAQPLVVWLRGGLADSACARMFMSGAFSLGLVVLDEAAQDGRDAPKPDFILESLRPAPWKLMAADGRPDPALDEARRAANHRALIKSLLIETIGPG